MRTHPPDRASSATTDISAQRGDGLASGNASRAASFIALSAVLVVVVVLSVGVGARTISATTILESLWAYDASVEAHVTIHELRIPRTVTGLVVAPALGLSGALIQAFTRNPLADPGILGVNAGAAFAVTVAIGILGITAPLGYVWFAMLGAAAVTVVVYVLGSVGGSRATPAKITLAGVAIGAVLGGATTAIVLASRDTFDAMRFWGVGSLAGRDIDVVIAFS
ncbi:MAG: iron chelate uptake ABC transporter family permease subunit, partial [Leucobacter sp.]|nr:iron chelate uptake ABC transporter family permease subunit [Leucobacter sp.]